MNKKVMVVDDQESLVTLITYNLNKEGFGTVCAYAGDEAMLVLEPDLLILDLMLPGKDGLEICRELRMKNNHWCL